MARSGSTGGRAQPPTVRQHWADPARSGPKPPAGTAAARTLVWFVRGTHGGIPHGCLVLQFQGSCETRRVWRRRHSMAPPALGSEPVGTVWKGPERHAAGGTHWSVDDMAGSTDGHDTVPAPRYAGGGVAGYVDAGGIPRLRATLGRALEWRYISCGRAVFSGGSVRHGMRHIPRHIPAGPPGSARRHARSAGRGISGPIGGCAVYHVPVRPRRRADPSPVWRHEVLLVPPQHLRRGMCVEWRPKRAPACVQYGPRRRRAELLFGVQTCVVGRVQEEHGRITHRPLRTTVRGAGWATPSTNTIWS